MVTTAHTAQRAPAPTETDQPTDPRAVLEAAQQEVHELSNALAALPDSYKQAVRQGDAPAMKAARVAKIDLEEQLVVAKILAVRAELAVLAAEIAALAPREQEAAQAVQATFGTTMIAKGQLETALSASNAAQAAAAVIRGQREDIYFRRMALQDRLKQLTSATLPE